MDTRVIQARLKKLDECYQSLERFRVISLEEYLQNGDTQAIVERRLQLAIQACLDIANYLIAHRQLKVPDDERDLFAVLAEAGIISMELARRMRGMINFRNILVHAYLEIDPALVHKHLTERLADLDEFAKAIVKSLNL
ncbi:DUF86 domain-containing protein [Candidatus Acetothermia bacterium]|nr:DUF86 domain-containing protein [Candidatus Acetothermia bacterium]MBI3660979.1 DUF86 domain-containing protein [Candidatus Acetothermia bacterium]